MCFGPPSQIDVGISQDKLHFTKKGLPDLSQEINHVCMCMRQNERDTETCTKDHTRVPLCPAVYSIVTCVGEDNQFPCDRQTTLTLWLSCFQLNFCCTSLSLLMSLIWFAACPACSANAGPDPLTQSSRHTNPTPKDVASLPHSLTFPTSLETVSESLLQKLATNPVCNQSWQGEKLWSVCGKACRMNHVT